MADLPPPRRSRPHDEPVAITLGLIAIVASLWIVSEGVLPSISPWLYVIWIITVAIGTNLGISFESSDANFANILIPAAFLSLGLGPATIVTLSGVVLSEVLRVSLPKFFNARPRTRWRVIVVLFSNLAIYVLSIIVGGKLYGAFGGVAPSPLLNVDNDATDLTPLIVPIIGLYLGYLVVNYSIFALLFRLEGHQSAGRYFGQHWRAILILEIAPIWTSGIIAFTLINTSILGFAAFCVFLITIMAIIHGLSDARARLEKRVQQVSSLSAVGQVLANSLDLPIVLETIYQQTKRLMVVRSFYVALYNGQDRTISFPLAYERGERKNYPTRAFSHGLTEYVIETARPLLIRDRLREQLPKVEPILTGAAPKSWLGVPILSADRILGVMVVQDVEQSNVYDEDHRDILVAIAAQAAAALQNAQMFETVQQSAGQLAMLNSVSTALGSTLDLNKLLDTIVTSIGQVANNQKAAIFLADESGKYLKLAASQGVGADYVARSQAIPIGLTERSGVVVTRKPLLVSDVQADPTMDQYRLEAESESIRAFADVPLQTRGEAIGSLAVYYTEPHQFTPAEVDLLITFANQVAVAVANAKLYAQTDQALARRVEQLATLEQISRDLSASLNFDQVIQRVLERALAATGADYGSVSLLSPNEQIIKVVATRGYSVKATEQLMNKEWPITRGIVGRALRLGQAIRIDDVQIDPEYVAVDPDVRSELALPIRREHMIIGAINLESTKVAKFESSTIEFVSQLAIQAAVALQNAQLYQQAQQRLNETSTLYLIGKQLASILDLSQLGQELVESMAHALDATKCSLELLDADTQTMQVIANYFAPGYEREEQLARQRKQTYPLSDFPMTADSFARHQPLVIYREDPQIDPSELAFLERYNLQCVLTMPLIYGDQVLGALEWADTRLARRFSSDELRFATTLANQAAIAVKNAQLYQAAQQRLNEMSILYTVGKQLTSILDLRQLGQELVEQLAQAIRTTHCSLEIWHSDSDFMETIAEYHSPNFEHSPASLHIDRYYRLHDYPATVQAVENHQPLVIYVSDPAADPIEVAALEQYDMQAMMTVPLTYGNEVVGTVEWGDERADHRFSNDELRFAVTLANQAAVAVKNAQLFEERAERINEFSQLYQASLALTASVELEEVLHRISLVAREITSGDVVTLYLYDAASDQFFHGSALGGTGEWSDANAIRRTGMTYRAIQSGQPILVGDTATEADINPGLVRSGVRSLICVPLISKGKPLGVLFVNSFSPYKFSTDDVQIASALANQAAIAIENARLFADIAEGRDKLQAILNSTHDGILMFDAQAKIVTVNPRLEEMWDLSRAGLEDRSLFDLLDQPEFQIAAKLGFTAETLRLQLLHVIEGEPIEWPKDTYSLSGTRPRFIERSGLPVRDASNRLIGWMLVLHDVTEERELQQLRDDLSNMIVHDLRSPLTGILGSLQMLEENIEEKSPASIERQALAISTRSTQKLLDMVNSLLDISKLTSGQAIIESTPAPLSITIDSAIERLTTLAIEEGVIIRKQIPADLPTVLMDEEKITRVLINLLDNAIKFSPTGGKVLIFAEVWPNHGTNGQPKFVRCAIRDSGPGVPPEFRERIFDRFVQITTQQGKRRGTGLGLSFCHLAIEAHGGKIWVDGAPGGGSEFSFTLPIADTI